MTKTLLLISGLIICACGQNKSSIKEEMVDSTEQVSSIDQSLDILIKDDLLWKGYRSLDSDSLSTNDRTSDSILVVFIQNGEMTEKKSYSGGDCEGLYKVYSTKDKNFTLIVDKFDCGDYGFSNNQYLTNRDSIVFFREFIVNWYNREIYDATERIITFNNGKTLIKERSVPISEYIKLEFKAQDAFKDSLVVNDIVYKKLKQDLANIKDKERI